MTNRPVFGTQEWAKYNQNCIKGCFHDCKYCYAKSVAIRFKRKTADNWKVEDLRYERLTHTFRKVSGRYMFPTSHDITPEHMNECIFYLGNILKPGNEVIVVSKPHLQCIKEMCDVLSRYKDQILFRFTIGSADSGILKF